MPFPAIIHLNMKTVHWCPPFSLREPGVDRAFRGPEVRLSSARWQGRAVPAAETGGYDVTQGAPPSG